MKLITMIVMAGMIGVANGAYAENETIVHNNPVKVVWKKSTKEQVIAITIDDCYNGRLLRKAVDVAEKYHIKLTFFPTGDAVRQHTEVWREINDKGYEIELHTQSHTEMTKVSEEQQYEAYRKNIETVRSAVGMPIKFAYVRPPCGSGVFGYEKHGCMPSYRKSVEQLSVYNGGHIDIAMWNGDSLFVEGRASKAEYVKKYFQDKLAPGMVYLYHTRSADIDSLEDMVRYALEQGYRMVTLKELMDMS